MIMSGRKSIKPGRRGSRKAILEHLKRDTLTSKQAFELYGVTRLSAIIFDFREAGMDIDTIPTEGETRFGEHCTYATYRLNGGNEE